MTMSHYFPDHSEEDEPTYIIGSRKSASHAADVNSRAGTAVFLAAEGIGYEAVRAHLYDLREEVYQ
ncbi:MAG TPA: hypothetical protein VKP04_02955, partial [Ktedonobacteraceae bacterium]|nr:hypothetical protein [Ktedonobacteraceae bacterium]